MFDQCLHLALVSERQERYQPHQALEHTGVTANERAVDAIQQDHELVAVTTEFRKLLQKDNAKV
jgi:hypothetical protein